MRLKLEKGKSRRFYTFTQIGAYLRDEKKLTITEQSDIAQQALVLLKKSILEPDLIKYYERIFSAYTNQTT